MGIVTVKSTAVSNATASPRVQNSFGLENGRVIRAINANVAVTNGDSANSVYRFGKVRSSDYIDRIRVVSADIGTTTTGTLGLHDLLTHSNGGTAVDPDLFTGTINLNSGAIDTDFTFTAGGDEAALYTNSEKRVWELLGLTSDPNKEYDVTLTLTGNADAAGTILVRVYVIR